jgi:hypothetical protein
MTAGRPQVQLHAAALPLGVSLGLGTAALASLLDPLRLAERGSAPGHACRGRRRRAAGDAPRAARQAGDLPVPERRAVAARAVRSQAAAAHDERRGAAGIDPHGPAAHGDDGLPEAFPLAGSQFDFAQHGKSGAWVSELLPHTARIADELCIVKSMHTEAINHDPAVTFFQTGSQLAGRPSMARGCRTASGPRTRTCRRSSCCSRARAAATSRSTRASGAAASCRRSTRACSSAAARTRCCT